MASQKKKKPSELKMTPQTFDKMNLTASGIVGVVETLRNKLNVLDGEIKADENGKAEYERQIKRLQIRRDEIKKRLDANEGWAETYDREIRGRTRVIQVRMSVPRARVPEKKHPRVESAPRDDRSSKNEPKRAETDRDTSLQSWKVRTLVLPR